MVDEIEELKESKVKPKMTLNSLVCENIQERFTFEKLIGEGAFGKVNIASLKAVPENPKPREKVRNQKYSKTTF